LGIYIVVQLKPSLKLSFVSAHLKPSSSSTKTSSAIDEHTASGNSPTTTGSSNESLQEKVLILIAHPDDECMFFSPTILALTQDLQKQVFVLSLSNGNFDGLGKIREKELIKSCERLGVPAGRVEVMDHP
jgi:hypothetical protein